MPPLPKCVACGKYLSQDPEKGVGVKCCKCSDWYHRNGKCVALTKTASVPTNWHCPECAKHVRRNNNDDTPVRGQAQPRMDDSFAHHMDTTSINTAKDDTQVPGNLAPACDCQTTFTKFKEDLINSIRHEFQLFRDDLSQIKSNIQAATDRISNLEERVTILENRPQSHPQVSDVEAIVTQLRSEINDRDQELLSNDIQISNLPELSGENPMHTVLLVATKIGVNIEERDIVSAERVGARRINATQPSPAEPRPRLLVVRLARRTNKEDLLQAARVRRVMTSADLNLPGPAIRIYINERLTKVNRELFRKAREIGGRHDWQFIWCKRGRILARKRPGDATFPIRCEADILRVFGTEPVTSGPRIP